MLPRLTAVAVAARLGVPVETLQQWTEELGIGACSTSGQRIFSPYELKVLETVKSLKDSDRGYQTICRRIGIAGGGEAPSNGRLEVAKAKAAVAQALQVSAEWMEKHAQATQQVGRLEERVVQLQARLEELRGFLAEGRLRESDYQRHILELERLLEGERKKSWWKRWLS